jgi:hypothetical protein
MYMVKKIVIISVCLTGLFQFVQAQNQTTVGFDSGSQTIFNQASTPLTAGTAADGDGAVLQLGYYDGASIANNFLGNWVPLSGEGSLNTAIIAGSSPAGETYNHTSIGDLSSAGAGANGIFALSLVFVVGDPASGNSLPGSTTIPLSIRFYNGTTIASSTFFNVVSDDLWLWKAPQPSNVPNNVAITLDQAGLEWLSIAQGGAAGTAFHTTLPTAIPEPSTLACLLLGGAGTLAIGKMRRRFKS